MRLTTVKLRRFERGVMQLELAKRAEIAFGRLSAIENGHAQPCQEELERIAAVLGLPLDRLVAARCAPGY